MPVLLPVSKAFFTYDAMGNDFGDSITFQTKGRIFLSTCNRRLLSVIVLAVRITSKEVSYVTCSLKEKGH